ncbi:conserved membrane hypothetical protein [Crenothrix polyspora]|uniref:DUF4407 domain-containing protein n=1 Tax=Crenothrix polyspora TaxID=360316 RepID=A0A1R4HCK5_9GAMM|nr:hypothetical protein [Crenothrix polyspora]SJM93939.1 conserved membrane hypothetical protein [Crenothrix polyspora]
METNSDLKNSSSGLGSLINRAQTLFVGMLRIWSIPIVLMLSVASGFTTYYGMSYFITPWIALIITIAIQSIIVICSLEIAGIHWKANRVRFLSVLLSLLVAITASITFSYFKFYEVSESETMHITRLRGVQKDVNDYLVSVLAAKSGLLKQQQIEVNNAAEQESQAYFGTHPQVSPEYRNVVGTGKFWKHYNQIHLAKKEQLKQMEQGFQLMDGEIRKLQNKLNQLDGDAQNSYKDIVTGLQEIQLKSNQLAASSGYTVPQAPMLMPYAQFIQGMTPSFAMWNNFSLFAFLCAGMVDFFTFLLSYRMEFTAPGPLNEDEQELVFECIKQFTEFRINENDELEMVIEKSDIERARRYSDLSRMFAVGFLLSRGFLRKIDSRSVEFAPNLYPLIAEKMSTKLKALKLASMTEVPQSTASPEPVQSPNEVVYEQR